MISIPQNLQIEAKNLIKNVFYSKCNVLFNDYLTIYFIILVVPNILLTF